MLTLNNAQRELFERMRRICHSCAAFKFAAARICVKTEIAEVYLEMELGHKTVLQFGEWLKLEGFSETVVKIFQGS